MAKQRKTAKPAAGSGKAKKADDACTEPDVKKAKEEAPKTRSVGIGMPMSEKEMKEIKKRSERLDE